MLILAAAHIFSLDFDSKPEILGETWQGFERMRDPVGAVLAILGVAALLHGLRHACLRWRARSPCVQITTFDWTGATEVAQPEAAWVTSLFRNELSALQLDALDALPERAPGAPLMEIVAGVGQGSSVGKAVVGLYKMVNPACAYTVWGTLRPHKERPGGFISVELVDRSRGDKSLISVTHEADDWAVCTKEAAMAVAGAVYPRVRHRHQGPWTRWTELVPSQLVMDYHAAASFERTRSARGSHRRLQARARARPAEPAPADLHRDDPGAPRALPRRVVGVPGDHRRCRSPRVAWRGPPRLPRRALPPGDHPRLRARRRSVDAP